MERLTCPAQGYCEMYCREYGQCFAEPETCSYAKEISLYERLKDYESSRLEPLEVRIVEQAKRDGRLFMPPVKVGDVAYFVSCSTAHGKPIITGSKKITEVGSRGFFVSADLFDEDSIDDFHAYDEIGKYVFLSPESAQAAIESEEQENERKEKGDHNGDS